MNRREAIETLKKAIAQVEWDYPMEIAAALDFAIADMKICEANNAEKAHILTVKELRKLPRTSADAIPVLREERPIFIGYEGEGLFSWIGSNLAWEQYNDTLRCAKQGREWYVLGKSLRFWSARPTREQSEEAEWDE